ncbi:MAG TPA: FG-GAP-like repeat-containing protein [Kofleriaceae bacterium]|nr:FG-GAP-like repeat-containing protein [Kofleriaceae bacterium]
MIRTLSLAVLGALFGLAACNSILGVDDFRGPNDGDGGSDDGGGIDVPDGPPATPALRAPRMGATTGSVHAAASLRPKLAWRTVPGATRYELAVDDSCQIASFKTCLFPSPEIMEANLTATTFTPTASLGVAMSAPVGRRYYWRTRACNEDGCSEWSEVWYLDVGRLADDVNGDGYGDLISAIQAEMGDTTDIGAAYIAFGRATAGTVTTTRLSDPSNQVDARFGSAVAMVGDVNADGYGDVAVGSWKKNEGTRTGLVYLYLGQGTWPATVTAETTRLVLAIGAPATAYGGAIAGRGDVNGDGFADIAVAASPVRAMPAAAGYTYVAFGRPTWSFSLVGAEIVIPDPAGEAAGAFGLGLSLGDLNEDGRADVLTSAPYASAFLGRSNAYFAPATIPSTPHTLDTPSITFPSPGTTGMLMFGLTTTICTQTGSIPAIAIGAPMESMPVTQAGVERIYVTTDTWPAMVTTASRALAEPSGAFLGSMGSAAKCEDVTGDGSPDLVVGAPTGDDSGAVYIFDNASGLPMTQIVTLTPGGVSGILGNGIAITDFNGDGVGDVFAGAPNLGATTHAGRVLGWLGRTQWPTTSSTPDITIDNPGAGVDQKFGRFLD